ncbi:unnamed protein product [Heligmosomoides polygyrus]|uniref:BLOC-1-related complex subunit 7 n=1 Tax=Heligmosomoides polygyrus TaxID=6339 RepID=A0A183F2N8_HELPZ|nr:unnamed protein product [Heligmosomoides polygyrus]
MGLGRRRPQPGATVEPPAKMLGRRRSLRNVTHQIMNRKMLLENDVESDPDSAIQNLITSRMWECKINLTQAKVLQTQCSNVEESSDPVVRSLTAIVVQQANAILGISAAVSISSKLKSVEL